MEPDERDAIAHTYWRRQLVLSLASALAVLVCCGLVALSVSSTHLWPALLAIVLTAAVLATVVVHAARVAAFTFRRGD